MHLFKILQQVNNKMWLDYKQYKHWELIDPILSALQLDLEDYLQSGKITHEIAVAKEREKLGMSPEEAKDWFIIPVYRAGNLTEWSDTLPRVKKLSTTAPGLINLTLNCFSPGTGAPIHNDYNYDLRPDLAPVQKCYSLLLGVKVPSNDIELNGFQVGDEKKLLTTGSIIAFDGGVDHLSWNHTTQWRYSANIDFEKIWWTLS
jgi:hypothetical protein